RPVERTVEGNRVTATPSQKEGTNGNEKTQRDREPKGLQSPAVPESRRRGCRGHRRHEWLCRHRRAIAPQSRYRPRRHHPPRELWADLPFPSLVRTRDGRRKSG